LVDVLPLGDLSAVGDASSMDVSALARMEELLFMQEDIKRARAQFLDPDSQNPNEY